MLYFSHAYEASHSHAMNNVQATSDPQNVEFKNLTQVTVCKMLHHLGFQLRLFLYRECI